MAVSQNTQRGLYAKHADETYYFRSLPDAECEKDAMRSSGEYRRVQIRKWNNGTKDRPIWEFKVQGWRK